MAPFRDCFTASEVVGAIVDRGDGEPLIGGAVPFYQRAKDPEYDTRPAQPHRANEAPITANPAQRVTRTKGASPFTANAESVRTRKVEVIPHLEPQAVPALKCAGAAPNGDERQQPSPRHRRYRLEGQQ